MISFQEITKAYQKDIVALKDINFTIEKNEFLTIVGKSGAGKTTLIKLLLREEEPTSGEIFFEGKKVSSIRKKDLPIYRRRIGVVFQDYKLLPTKNVFENVSFAMEAIGASEAEIKRDVNQVLEIVGLEERTNNFPKELSGGEKQRVAIARALIIRPDVIIADEPTGNLDPYHSEDIIDLLCKINQLGTTIILATHDRSIISRWKKRIIVLDNGSLIRDEKSGNIIF